MKNILVTGDTGFVGRHLMHHIGQTGDIGYGYSSRYGKDIRDYEALRGRIVETQPDIIHHLAAQAFVPEAGTNPQRAYDVNVGGTLNLMRAVRETGSRAIVHIAGTSEEYGYETQDRILDGEVAGSIDEESPTRPTTLYGSSKLAASQLALTYGRMYGIPVVVTRAYNHTGVGQSVNYALPSFASKVALVEAGRMPAVLHGNLQAVRDYTDVRDIVRAYRLAVGLAPGVYNVATDNPQPMSHFLHALVGLATVAIPLEPDPHLYRPGYTNGGTTFPRPDTSKFRAASGWTPEFSTGDMLANLLDYWRTQV